MQKKLTGVLVSIMAVLIGCIVLLAAVPPVSRDALIHHLAVPKLWIRHGGIYEIPDMVFSYYPMALDVLYAIPLYFGNDIVPKYIHFAFALATAWLIWNYLKSRLNSSYAVLGALFFLSTPVIVKLSITAYVDLGLVFFSTAGLLCILKWNEGRTGYRYLIAGGLCCGLALSTKYNGLIVFLMLFLLVAYCSSRGAAAGKHGQLKVVQHLLIFSAVATALFAPWGIKNTVWTGNPLFPLFDSWFNGATPGHASSIPPMVLRKVLYGESWWEIVLVPLRIFFQGVDDSPRYFDGKLNPALIIFPLFSILTLKPGKQRAEKKIMALFAVMFILLVFFQTTMRIRYVAPVIPILVILSMFGLNNISGLLGERFSRNNVRIAGVIVLVSVSLMFSTNIRYVIDQFKVVTPVAYVSGRISRDNYIERFRPEYAAIKYSNDHLKGDINILSLFIGGRGYYIDNETHFDIEPLRSAVMQSGTQGEIGLNLRRLGFTHVLLRRDMFNNWCHNNLSKEQIGLVADFFKEKGRLLFSKDGHDLYRL